MLQFVIQQSDKWTILQQAEMAVTSGCRWIQIAFPPAGNDTEQNRESIVEQLIPVCKQHETFLIVEDDVELVDKLKVHGVFLHDGSRTNVTAIRERLGAEAVIGVAASSAQDLLCLKGLDIDYVTIPTPDDLTTDDEITEFYATLIRVMQTHGLDVHFVADTDSGTEILSKLIAAGCAGVAVSALIANSDDPTEATKTLLATLETARTN